MKNFFKKLAFVLALAMVVTAVAPAATASAAKAPSLNTTGKKLYIGGDKTGEYSNKFTLKVWNKGNYSVTFKSSDDSIATVTKWYGVVEAKAVGTATITATVTNKTTKKVVKTLSAKVYVKKNADSVAFGKLTAFDEALVVGDKVKVNVARKAGEVSAWKQADKTAITDYVVWASSNTDVATVDKWGTVKAVAPGEATISAVATQIEGKVATTEAKSFKVTVVGKGITDLAQKSATKLDVTFGAAQDTDKVTKDTLVIAPADASKATPLVKEIKWNDAKTVATVEVYVSFDDKAVYTVKVKDTDSTKDFTASVGAPASITITKPSTVVISEDAVIEYAIYDANGVQLPNDNDKVEVKPIEGENNGYITRNSDGNHTISIYEKGKSVVIKLIYHTGEWSNEGVETTFESNAFAVTAIEKTDATLGETKFTVVDGGYSKANFDKVNKQITIGNFAYTIQAKVKDSTGATYTTESNVRNNFTFDSMDKSIVMVDEDGTLFPVSVGTAVVKVTVSAIDKPFLVQITVAAESKVVSVAFDKVTGTYSNAYGLGEATTVTATLKDQYGNDIKADLDVNCISKPKDAKNELEYEIDSTNAKKILFNVEGATPGTYTFSVKAGDITRNVTVFVKGAETVVDSKYMVVLSTQSVDMARNNDNADTVSVNVTVYGLDKNGVKAVKYAIDTDYTATIKNGDSESKTGSIDIIKAVSGSGLDKVGKKGSYSVEVKNVAGKLGSDTARVITKTGFSVVDSQVVPVIKQDKTTVDANTNAVDAFEVITTNSNKDKKIVEIYGYLVGSGDHKKPIKLDVLSAKGNYVITSIKVEETYSNGNYYVHTIEMNKYLTVK